MRHAFHLFFDKVVDVPVGRRCISSHGYYAPMVMRVQRSALITWLGLTPHSARSSNRARTVAAHAEGARIRESGKKATDLLNDIFLVSSVSVLANVGSAKDFSLRGGGSWCAFPAVLPSS